MWNAADIKRCVVADTNTASAGQATRILEALGDSFSSPAAAASASAPAPNVVGCGHFVSGAALRGVDCANAVALVEEHYELQEPLNRGKFGVVHRALKHGGGGERAVKTMRKATSPDGRGEVELANSVGSERVMTFEAVYETAQQWHLVSEHYSGGDLFDLVIRQKSFAEADAAVLFRQIVQGIAACHDAHIVHLDIKPENFCLRQPVADGRPGDAELVLIDLGYATRVCSAADDDADHHTEWGLKNVAGSVTYAAPELSLQRFCKASDMWSSGVMLFIMLTGQPPWEQDHSFDAEQKRELVAALFADDAGTELSATNTVAARHPAWQAASPQVRGLVRQLLQVDPTQRPSAKSVLAHEWLLQHEQQEREQAQERELESLLGSVASLQARAARSVRLMAAAQ